MPRDSIGWVSEHVIHTQRYGGRRLLFTFGEMAGLIGSVKSMEEDLNKDLTGPYGPHRIWNTMLSRMLVGKGTPADVGLKEGPGRREGRHFRELPRVSLPHLFPSLCQKSILKIPGLLCWDHLAQEHLSCLLPGLSKRLEAGWGSSSCESDRPHAGSSLGLGPQLGAEPLPWLYLPNTRCTAKCGSELPWLTGDPLSGGVCPCRGFYFSFFLFDIHPPSLASCSFLALSSLPLKMCPPPPFLSSFYFELLLLPPLNPFIVFIVVFVMWLKRPRFRPGYQLDGFGLISSGLSLPHPSSEAF